MTRTAEETDDLLDLLLEARVARCGAEADNEDLRRERDEAVALHRAAEDECEGLRMRVLLAEVAVEEARIVAEQAELEAHGPSWAFTFGHLAGVGLGAVVLGAASGAGAVVTLLGRWPW